MHEQLAAWDGQGVVVHHDAPSDAWFFIAIHDTTLGPGAGGTRMRAYPSLDAAVGDAQRLAAGMTEKLALAELPFGGAKAVLAVPAIPQGPERRALLHRFGDLVGSLRGTYLTGPDVNTTADDMAVIAERTRHVFARPIANGGAGPSGPWTARGVRYGIRAACRWAFGDQDLTGRTVAIQGVGEVGSLVAERLAADGARLVVADADEERARSVAARTGARVVPPGEILDVEADVFAPCAVGGVIDAATVPRLRCAIVAGAANNQLATPEDGERLAAAGILFAPDVIVNAGGAIGIMGLEEAGWTLDEVEGRLRGIGDRLIEVLGLAARDGLTPAAAASRLARERLEQARGPQARVA